MTQATQPTSIVYQRDSFLACRQQAQPIVSTEDRPLAEDPLDSEVLTMLECPFLDCCELVSCPFGHPQALLPPAERQSEGFDQALRPIPWYFCMDRLIYGQCENHLERIGNLIRCECGFHPSNDDLLEPDQFTGQLAAVVLATKCSQSFSAQCVCCLKTITGICALLENCPHLTCGGCIAFEFESIRPHISSVCRVCGVTSSRLMLWPQPVISRAYQQLIFSLQKRAFGLLVGPQSHVAVHEPADGDQVIVYYRGTLTESKIAAYQLESRNRGQPTPPSLIPNPEGNCVICLKSIAASPDRIWAYLENCNHRFCLRCILMWRTEQAPTDPWTALKRIDFACPTCRAPCARILLWPEAISNATFQQSLFAAQKMCLGLWVTTQTSVSIHEDRHTNRLAFICNGQVWIPQDPSTCS